MRDLGPGEMARFRRVADAFRAVCGRWAFREIRTPAIEHLHLFTSSGTLSPQLLDRVYSFLDWDGWSGERVVLRPDSTIAVARFFREQGLPTPARLFYLQDVFRFAGGDEERELWQCGAELIGDTEPRGDLELILMAAEVLESLELSGIEVSVSHTGIVRGLLAAAGFALAEQAALYDRLLDGDLAALGEIETRLPELNAPLHLLFESSGGSVYTGNLRGVFERAVPALAPAFEVLEGVTRVLEGLGLAVRVVTALARNFEYYTATVFRFAAQGVEVGGGGRYDALLTDDSGKQMPASGFMLEIGRLMALLPGLAEPEEETLLVRALDDSTETLAAAIGAIHAAHRRGASARLAAIGEGGRALEVGGTPPAFRWETTTIDAHEDAVAAALGLPR